jgi:Ca-activated chloride channel homolog
MLTFVPPIYFFCAVSPLGYGSTDLSILYLEFRRFSRHLPNRSRPALGKGELGVHALRPLVLLKWKVAAVVALSACAAWAADPQEPMVTITPRNSLRTRAAGPHANLKIDSTMILVPVSVTDAKDQPVTDLSSGSFRIFEDNVEQKVVSLHKEEGPVSVGFIFDASSSMKKRMDRSVAAIQQFLNNTAMPGDEFFLVRFADRPTLITTFTKDPDEILGDLSSIQPDGWTALNDAICLGVHQMKHAKNSRRALFVLTDGGDNNSRYSDSELRNLVRESDVRIYSIGLFERPQFLEKLGMDSGGRAFYARKMEDLPQTIEKLSRDFRNQYVLGYYPNERPNDGKYRNLRVELMETLKRLPLNVFWRRGYYSPFD